MATRGARLGGLLTTGVGVVANLLPSKFERTGEFKDTPKRMGADIIKYGVSQTNLGFVTITSPPIMMRRYNIGAQVQGAGSFIEAFNVPGKSIQTSDVRRFGIGPLHKTVVGTTSQNTTTMTMIGDAQGRYYNFYYLWMNSIVRFEGMDKTWMDEDNRMKATAANGSYPFEVAYFKDYSTNITMHECNARMDLVTKTDLLGAFPIAISEKQMNWNNTGMMSFTVEFAYNYTTIKDVEEGVVAFQQPPTQFNFGVVSKLIKAGNAIQLAQSIRSSGGSGAAALVAVGASALSAF